MSGQCDAPFVSASKYPSTDGDLYGRICFKVPDGDSFNVCCLPCPYTDWIYSESYPQKAQIANYISIISFVLNVFLLLTFAVLPKEKSQRHYLSTGLTVSLISIAIAFIIPLGTKPNACYNEITPNTDRTDLSCAFTGAFVEVGAMGVVVWILLRSIYTALRIMANFNHFELFRNISIGIGTGVPLILLLISMPITGVAYRIGNVCVPDGKGALATWFAWVIIFALASLIIQLVTIFFCIYRFASSIVAGPSADDSTVKSNAESEATASSPKGPELTPWEQSIKATVVVSAGRQRRIAWRKAKQVLMLQWRSILLAFLVANLTIFFAMVFIQGMLASESQYSTGTGISESRALGALTLASFIGIIMFLLMVRGSMFVGWWELIRNPGRLFRRSSVNSDDFLMVTPTRTLEKEDNIKQIESVSEPEKARRQSDVA